MPREQNPNGVLTHDLLGAGGGPSLSHDSVDARTVFIVGAGFSVDANTYLDTRDKLSGNGYPLVGDLANVCFEGKYDLDHGVEAAFAHSLRIRDSEPVQRLAFLIESADYHVGTKVARAALTPYSALIDRFPRATFLSFNYDGLIELVLHSRHIWTPRDGFGVNCRLDIDESYIQAPAVPSSSQIPVLHLHGSVYLYPLEFETYERSDTITRQAGNITWIRETSGEEFRFDPDMNSQSFVPFRGGALDLRYKHPDERLIVPVPDKSSAVSGRFSRAVFKSAIESLLTAELCVVIGYRFAECDMPSFWPLLTALRQRKSPRLYVVAPDASNIRERLKSCAPWLDVVPLDASFGDWAQSTFPT